jgi:asparagine synthase (glutamine-hydrolysing)
MALIVMLHDADPERRRQTITAIQNENLPNAARLILREWSHGSWHMIARAAPSTPFTVSDAKDNFSVITGKLLDRDLNVVRPEQQVPQPLGGFGVKISVDTKADQLSADTDFLGVFPLYYASGRDWMMVSSSPWIMKCHPDFQPSWNLEGVASLLLTMHLVTGQTVWNGVRRLNAGSQLSWSRQHGFRESAAYRLRNVEISTEDRKAAIIERFDRVIRAWKDPDASAGMLLSGGLDSRLLAGILRRITHGNFSAYTNGLETDLEVQCARLVCDRLRVHHQVWENSIEDQMQSHRWNSTLELASNGSSASAAYAVGQKLQPGQSVVTGYCLDLFMSSSLHFRDLFDPSPDGIMNHYGRWGFSPDKLKRLQPDTGFQQAVEAVRLHQRKIIITGYGTSDMQEAAQWHEAYFRQRHHVAGMGWRLCWNVWPVMPALDAPTIELLFSVPREYRNRREMERDLVRKYFPTLARLPLDRNTSDTSPLLPIRWRDRMIDQLRGRRSAVVTPVIDNKQLRYYRMLDINAPNWKKMREEFEPLRSGLHGLFDAKGLETLLPKPDVVIPMERPIPESSGRKTLLSLMVMANER